MYDYHLCEERDVLCIDQKSFFASVSCMSKGLDPSSVKLAVVADTKRQGSVVLAATPPLRALGIKTGSRLFEIPHHHDIYIINPSMKLYLEVASKITEIALKYVAPEDFHQYSIDEFFMDVSRSYGRFADSAAAFAVMLKDEIFHATHIQCAVGIGSNVLLSKLALDFEAKKSTRGIAEWRYHDVPEKLWSIEPLHQFWGINRRMEKRLNQKGIFTVGQLAHYPHHYLKRDFGVIGVDLHLHANGIDTSIIREKHQVYKPSICKSQILMRDYAFEELRIVLLEQAEEVTFRLRAENRLAKTITFAAGYSDEGKVSKAYTLSEGTNLTRDVFQVIWGFMEQLCDRNRRYRTLSVTLSNFIPEEDRQLTLFIDEFSRSREEQLAKTIDRLKRKYGPASVVRASSCTAAGTALKRSGLIAGHKA
ncbi:Y-family DNA polymerase [Macrococcus equipercicus]|uniref:Y-family DNA polymerase n=1 Tax=Macrococcus equipercicus TaxID=69967 RepID=A0A9Q9BTS5_9STAP|nr:Y-family DNA polymerase [Macrococcus equipercicus]KAA1040274.1 Y-family DNA polymerase [Macrococcus equipercicus]UTH12782.1 Y-family DNA polymerase [Macrococcus equipercicus]